MGLPMNLLLRFLFFSSFAVAFSPIVVSLSNGREFGMSTKWKATSAAAAATTTSKKTRLGLFREEPEIGRRKVIDSLITFTITTTMVNPFGSSASAAASSSSSSGLDSIIGNNVDTEGLASVTQSELGKSVRRTAVRGAQIADRIDMSWERFSDSLRDKNRCDPTTNRRLFDNGTRRDGTKIGNPVLGAMCDPVPLRPLDVDGTAALVLNLADKAAVDWVADDEVVLKKRVDGVKELVGASFSRAGAADMGSGQGGDETEQRRVYNMDIYTRMRAYGELISDKSAGGGRKALNEATQNFELAWGTKMLESLAKGANRKNFNPAFPLPSPEDMGDQPYDEGRLLDALGSLSVALEKMQEGGIIGHWEISIPEDDYGSVVTVAVDDDISIGSQILLREQGRPLGGSSVIAMVKSALDKAKITYGIDAFFIDPTTTKQELYNPTQLLVSLSNLGE